MLFKETGNKGLPAIILLHGGGISWWSLSPVIELFKERYHVITPIIDGHGEDGDTTFLSIKDSADKLLAYIDSEHGGTVFALCGLSLGAQIATELLSRRPDVTSFAILESALVIPMRRLTSLTVPMTKISYPLIRFRWFAKLQSKPLFVPECMFEQYYLDSMRISKQSLVNIIVSNGNYELKYSIKDTTAKVLVISGEKELGVMKKSAQLLRDTIPRSTLHFAPKMKHGELSLARPAEFASLLEKLFNG
jgi:pimeloyl-ACP methyl ester carboxylesterase